MPITKEQRQLLKDTKFKSNRDIMRLGFVFKDLSARQEYVYFAQQSNELTKVCPSVSISCFFLENSSHIIPFKGAAFHVSDAWHNEGNLVATSFETLYSIKNCTNSNIILYLNDIEYERAWFKYTKENIKELLKIPSKIIFRSKGHYDKLLSDNVLEPVEDLYISNVIDLKLILELCKNAK